MASFLLYGEGMPSDYVSLTPREAASGVFGSVSLTCWIFLLVCYSLDFSPVVKKMRPLYKKKSIAHCMSLP